MNIPWIGALAAFCVGLILGIVVTRNLHDNPRKKFWNVRLGSTPWRRANLPLGGTLGAVVAGVAFAFGWSDAGVIVATLALGMAAGAIGVGVVDPLPRA